MAELLAPQADTRTPLQIALARKVALYNERSTWIEHYRDLAKVMAPRLGRFIATDRNKGTKKHQDVLDSQAILANRVLAAGMMSGMTSPARPWFRFGLGLDMREMEKRPNIARWLFASGEVVRAIFADSNTYRILHSCYTELGVFGTWAGIVEDDFENVMHTHGLTVGEYMLANSEKGYVDTLCREFQMTTAQLVRKFGYAACSEDVRRAWDQHNYDNWFDVVHLIEPNDDRDVKRADYRGKPWRSMYFQPGRNPERFLRQAGYDRSPILAPRWDVTGNDAYGNSPGMDCLGTTKQLQHRKQRGAQAIDFQVNPPLAVPLTYNEKTSSRLPGGIMFYGADGHASIKSAYDVQLNLQHLQLDIQDLREEVKSAFYVDMFLMLMQDRQGQMTATEVAERHEEKLLMLGPVLERLHNELLGPLVEAAFHRALEAGILPPTPRELDGVQIKVNFISTLAQAQRAVGAAGIDRWVGTLSTIASQSGDVSVWDNVQKDTLVQKYGDMFGVDPEVMSSEEQRQAARDERARQEQAALASQAAPGLAKAVKDVGTTPTGGGSSTALQDVLGMFTGYNQPTPLDAALQ